MKHWHLTSIQNSSIVGKFTKIGSAQDSPLSHIASLLSGLTVRDLLADEF